MDKTTAIKPITVSGTFDLDTRLTADELLELKPGDIIKGACLTYPSLGRVEQTTARRVAAWSRDIGYDGELSIRWENRHSLHYIDVSEYSREDSHRTIRPGDDETAAAVGRKPQYETVVRELFTSGSCYQTIHRVLANGIGDPRWPNPGTDCMYKLTVEFL